MAKSTSRTAKSTSSTEKRPEPPAALIDGHVSLEQCKLAVDALHKHFGKHETAREETDLLPVKEQHVWLNVTVKKITSAHRFKPVKIPIVHPIVDPRVEAVCLITKDPQRKYKDLLEENGIKFISRVVGIEKLKGKFKPFEARRQLLKQNGLFLADERVVPLLPKLLGVKWFEAKKQPIPVCLTRKDLKGELERAISSTYMNQNQGTCTAIKIAKLPTHTAAQTMANLAAALPAAVNGIKGGWDNVQSLILKTNSSAGLPIWSCDLGEGRWAGMEVELKEDVEEEESSAVKGKKRVAVGDEDEDEPKPKKKKAKSVEEVSEPTAKSMPAPPPTSKVDAPKKKDKVVLAETSKKVKRKEVVQDEGPLSAASPKTTEKKKKVKLPESEVVSEPEPPQQPKEKKPVEKEALKEEKTKKKKEKAVVPEQRPVPVPPTADELKQKRVGKAGERKKEVVVGGKDGKKKKGKSAKDALVGRKAGQ
ncbi:ribosomal protein L1p/L10e family-domain-containing protein [Mycena amicta]|nr:ribosomal protein L1p/L10e family-domain-containing protein [Mycena amicta]